VETEVAALSSNMELISNTGDELVQPDYGVDELIEMSFDALVLSDGSVSDDLRYSEGFQELLREVHKSGKIIATIDVSVRYLIDAGIAANHELTGSPLLRFELETHGATYMNEAVWVDGNLISGRLLEDMQAFCDLLVNELSFEAAA
jgi:protease I